MSAGLLALWSLLAGPLMSSLAHVEKSGGHWPKGIQPTPQVDWNASNLDAACGLWPQEAHFELLLCVVASQL